MTVTRRQAKTFMSLFLLGWLLIAFPTLSKAQNEEQANVWRVVEQFFAAFAQKDFPTITAMFSDKSPDNLPGRANIHHTFSANRTIAVKDIRQDKISVEKDRATDPVDRRVDRHCRASEFNSHTVADASHAPDG